MSYRSQPYPHCEQAVRDRRSGFRSVALALVLVTSPWLATATDLPQRWAFEPLAVVTPPRLSKADHWVKNPIDAFILARQQQSGLKPARAANRLTLLRRVSFDLTGLPPSPEQIAQFLNNRRPDAYQELVDGLLGSPQYGERWARHWLDLARYADTGGFEKDLAYPNAWRYRDYVIDSLNANKPMDRFIEEQVAGDELWPEDPLAKVATSFYTVGPASQDSALMSTQLEYEWLTDAADTTGAAFLGLTMGCARCHNHKYDPLTQNDYFGMQAIFAASDRPYPAAVREHRIKGLNGILADVPIPRELLQDPRCTIKTDEQAGIGLFHRENPMEINRLKRGELSKPLEVVPPALPAVLRVTGQNFDPAAVPANQRRAVFAKWLVSSRNPLTARVLVNRIWAWHFGQGIVRTPNDFGAQGERPTHTELLDWLAHDFIDHGWDLKRLHRLIVSSASYQTQSGPGEDAKAAKADPENRLLCHFPRRRLDAESIWDAMHYVAGTLNPKLSGPPVMPELSKEELSGLFDEKSWSTTKDPAESNRRGIYLFERRTFLFPIFDAFDPPDVMSSCPRRFETTVPTQALALWNSSEVRGQAKAFADRLRRDCGNDLKKIAARAWILTFNRAITASENRRIEAFFRKHEGALQNSPTGDHQGQSASQGGFEATDPGARHQSALEDFCLALLNANEFVFID